MNAAAGGFTAGGGVVRGPNGGVAAGGAVAAGGVKAGGGGGAACGCENTQVMSYVGPCGSYNQDVQYQYVGQGCGDFEVVTVQTGCKCTAFWVCISAGSILGLLIWFFCGMSNTTTTTTVTSLPYDCSAGVSNWEDGWSVAKKAWCCDHTGTGCPRPTTTPKEPYCCKVHGNPAVVFGWSVAHKSYCCQRYGTGCPHPHPHPHPNGPVDPYNCAVAPYETWCAKKKAWCCTTHHICGPPAPAPAPAPVPVPQPVTSLPYDCDAGFANWVAGWSMGKKAWCCQHMGRGCPATSSNPYDCNAGYVNWQNGWSAGKKAWCCAHGGRGCATTACPYDCAAGFANWQNGWSEGKKAFCCRTQGKGCTR